MPAGEYYRRRSEGAIPRVFVDITTSLMLAGEHPTCIPRMEREVTRRLSLFSTFNFIPVAFGNDGLLFALSPEQVALIFSTRLAANSQQNRLRKQSSSRLAAKSDAAVDTERNVRRKPGTLRLKLHHAALVFIAWMPEAVREDVRAILIHGGQLVRIIISRAVREDVRAILIHAGRIVRAIFYRHPLPIAVSIPARSVLPKLQIVVHPRSGDVLWTAGSYSNFVPLRTIAEIRVRSGLRVVTFCDDVIPVAHSQFNPGVGAELLTADEIALLDASDLVLAVSERTQRELVALAARFGREPPAVQVLQTSGLRQLLDLDNDESLKATVAPAVTQPNLGNTLPQPRLWEEVTAAVKERLQTLAAETYAG
jgi:hypothetical protein